MSGQLSAPRRAARGLIAAIAIIVSVTCGGIGLGSANVAVADGTPVSAKTAIDVSGGWHPQVFDPDQLAGWMVRATKNAKPRLSALGLEPNTDARNPEILIKDDDSYLAVALPVVSDPNAKFAASPPLDDVSNPEQATGGMPIDSAPPMTKTHPAYNRFSRIILLYAKKTVAMADQVPKTAKAAGDYELLVTDDSDLNGPGDRSGMVLGDYFNGLRVGESFSSDDGPWFSKDTLCSGAKDLTELYLETMLVGCDIQDAEASVSSRECLAKMVAWTLLEITDDQLCIDAGAA